MFYVEVYHRQISEITGEQIIDNGCPMFTRVANVMILNDDTAEDDALEYAWRWTNNTLGSWSAGERDDSNGDFNYFVEVVEPLAVIDGKEWGHRSSMWDDVFYIGNKGFRVAAFGFLPLEDDLVDPEDVLRGAPSFSPY